MEALPYGDYGCEYQDGWRAPFYVERKGIGDLFGTMTGGYKRFKREMERALEAQSVLVLAVEGTYTDVLAGTKHSQFDGESMVKKLETLKLRYGLETWYCQSRWEMAKRIESFFYAVGRAKYGKH